MVKGLGAGLLSKGALGAYCSADSKQRGGRMRVKRKEEELKSWEEDGIGDDPP